MMARQYFVYGVYGARDRYGGEIEGGASLGASYIINYPFRHNPLHSNREQIHFEDIWFVAQEWATK